MKKEFKNIQTFEQYTDKNLNISDVSDSIYYIYDELNKKYYAGIPNTHDVFSKYKSEANILSEIKSITSSIINKLISLSPDAFSLELTNEESIFYTFKKDAYSFYIQHYFETEDDGFNATLVTFKGDNKIDSINGDINNILASIEAKVSNNNSHNLNLAFLNELSY